MLAIRAQIIEMCRKRLYYKHAPSEAARFPSILDYLSHSDEVLREEIEKSGQLIGMCVWTERTAEIRDV
jgi:hypothetical protein